MSTKFKTYLKVGAPFFLLRLGTAVLVGVIYILLAAGIQYMFVDFFGENTFNYIVGGLLSLFLGIIFCHYVGTLIFMFVKGWHVSALAYAPKIQRSGASAIDVGIRAFNKNLISFGAVYAVRNILTGLLSRFTHRLWELFGDNPFAQTFMKISTHPIVEYLAKDILHYGFDATIFYLVRHPADDVNGVPSTVLTAIKKYLYCLPGIMLTSLQTFMLFRLLPQILKWIAIVWVFLSNGIVAGILLTVLMYPIFYVLENALFDPLMMTMFIVTYSKKCDEELAEDDPIVTTVNSILEEEESITDEENNSQAKDTKPTVKRSSDDGHKKIQTTITSEEELGLEPEPAKPQSPQSIAESLQSLVQETRGDAGSSPELEEAELEDIPLDVSDDSTPPPPPPSLSDIARGRAGGGGLGVLSNWQQGGLDDEQNP